MLGEGFDFLGSKSQRFMLHTGPWPPLCSLSVVLLELQERSGQSDLLAVPDDIEIERRRLFEVGSAWQEIVENLNAEQMEKELYLREVLESFDPPETRRGP